MTSLLSLLGRFHRFLLSLIFGLSFFAATRQFRPGLIAFCIAWILLFAARRIFLVLEQRRNFRRHGEPFRKMFGPYGQKILRAAETDRTIRRRLNEAFSPRRSQVEETVNHLRFMNELARLGMRSPGIQGEAEELALAYSKARLEQGDFAGHRALAVLFPARKKR